MTAHDGMTGRDWLVLACDGHPAFGAQVFPPRIHCFDQRNLPSPKPSLQFLLARDRRAHIAKRLKVDKLRKVVPGREAWDSLTLVLDNPPLNIVRNSDVNHTRCASHDINAIRFHAFRQSRVILRSVILRRVIVRGAILPHPLVILSKAKNPSRLFFGLYTLSF